MSPVLITCVLVAGLTQSAGGEARARAEPDHGQLSRPTPVSLTVIHAVRGVGTSFGVTWLTVTRPGKTPGELTFVLTPSTLREGRIEVGAIVSVRYRVEGPSLVATAVVVRMHTGVRPQGALKGVPLLTAAALSPRAHRGEP
jgi:hypothetical protein